jgi:hypothetical protein
MVGIMLLRHGEERERNHNGHNSGVDELGHKDAKSLTVRGWQRAGGLAVLFQAPPAPLTRPSAIFASGPRDKHGPGSPSQRPSQTIAPLARRLDLMLDLSLSRGEEEELANRLRGQQSVLVSWQHEFIAAIVRAVVGRAVALPDWHDDVFDEIWLLTATQTQQNWTLTRLGQGILAGDRTGLIGLPMIL